MKYLRKNDCIMLAFSVVLFAVLQVLITERAQHCPHADGRPASGAHAVPRRKSLGFFHHFL